MKSFRLCGEKPFVLALFPLEAGSDDGQAAVARPEDRIACGDPGGRIFDVGEPAVDRGAELGLPPESRGEGDVADPEAEAAPQLGERAELVQLAQAVEPVARRRA